tara:strand:- start:368 stop:1378 length:1011 start_codon:yes stop_codon:yes gene_type:complete
LRSIKSILLFVVILHLSSYLFPNGPYSIETLTEQDGLRNGPDYSEALLYYPIEAPTPTPVVILIPGFTNSISEIQSWGTFLASYGYTTFLINVNSFFLPPFFRSEALLDAIVTIKIENERLGSPLFGILNTEDFTVGGYSMGGGGALLASQQDSSIKAVVALAAWLDNPSITLDNNTATLFISGEFDNIAPNNIHTDVFYNNTSEDIDKLLYEISGGFHNTVTSPYNDEEMGLKTLFWIQKYILNDFSNCDSLITEPPTASTFLTNIDCSVDIIGDITQDGITNVLDLVLLISWIVNGIIPSGQEMAFANIVQDNTLDIFDIIMLAEIISSNTSNF